MLYIGEEVGTGTGSRCRLCCGSLRRHQPLCLQPTWINGCPSCFRPWWFV
jgi:hypothetical protein